MGATGGHRWLVDITLDGRTYRWAVDAVEVTTADGTTLYYEGGLDALEAARGDSVPVTVTDPSVDWPALAVVAEGAPTTLRRWRVGTVLEAAEIFAVGRAASVEYGAPYEPVTWTIETERRDVVDLGRQIPDPTARVDETTWPSPDYPQVGTNPVVVLDSMIGRYYPIIFGYPGYEDGTIVPAVPVPHGQIETVTAGAGVGYQRIIVSEDVAAPITSVEITDLVSRGVVTCAVETAVDALGRSLRVAVVEPPDGVTSAGDIWLLSEADDADPHAGYSPTGGGGVARSAYDVLVYVLRRWGVTGVDWARLPEIAEWLAPFQVDTYIDEVVSDPWAWWAQAIMPDLPVAVATSRDGRYLVPLRYRPDAGRVVARIDTDRGDVRVSTIETSWGGRNELVAVYGWSPVSESWRRRVVLTGSGTVGLVETPPTDVKDIIVRHRGCAVSQARHGVRQGELLEIDWTWDAGTVTAVLSWMADRDALTTRTVQYLLPETDAPEEGDTLTVTDAEVGLNGALGIVEGAPLVSEEGVTVTVRIPETQ